ncbi:MAG: DUF4105 domain-containing protein [Flavobacteriales bacterium]|nr:DUF4105 domain-containing protein [Flavobacteriales bacterium]MBT3964207.1 DUF4105 domain-containing protein [Flavobacteriales bacterium]MBT4704160.1 DUF4105 domain-containing protein [Flavobacteriales bacterium]MBT4930020.1 DUF4105 domain-containing protein [Flavobacteriales bacterium]MBT5132394.1 DUF4105 domain-containing protein [Flavobacteriales bacterium]
MKIIYILILSLLYSVNSISQSAPILSNSAEISLLTCSPGAELYSLFGHSAMRVQDPSQDIDLVFNYGTFSFDEDFYFNFTMGRLNYRLAVSSMENFLWSYEYEGRGVIEQVLDLDSIQKQRVMEYLHWNYQPENRYYLYDFFYDNCSSILRDVLETALDGQVLYKDLTKKGDPSFRNMIDEYLVYHQWGDFGIDLGLGLPCDVKPRYIEYMFLPNELSAAFENATLENKPLVKENRSLLETQGLTMSNSLTNPIPLFWILFGLVAILSAIGYRKQKLFIGLDIGLFIIYGAVGALIAFLWFITDHSATAENLNILWAWPIHLIAIPFLFNPRFKKMYWTVYGSLLILTLIAFPFLPQMLHVATIPLMCIMIVRAGINYKLGA